MPNFLYFNSVILFGFGFILSLILVWGVREICRSNGFVSPPRKDRWHTKPTALHGGLAMIIPFFIGAMVILEMDNAYNKQNIFLLVGSLFMCFTGLLDDLKGFKPLTKFFLQMIPAILMISVGVIINFSPYFALNVLITVFWYIGIINSINMLDNMDGLSSGVVLIACLTLALMLIPNAQEGIIAIKWLFLMAGILFGFLVFNFKPASIFMGDSGSLFLGFFIASMAIPSQINHFWHFPPQIANSWHLELLLAPALLLIVPIFDTTLVTVSRKWFSRKASQGGRDHSSHRLCTLGLSEKNAVLLLYLFGCSSGAILYLLSKGIHSSWPYVCIFLLGIIIFGLYLGKVKSYGKDSRQSEWAEKLEGVFRRRKFFEMLVDIFQIAVAYRLSFSILYLQSDVNFVPLYVISLPWVILFYFGFFVFFDFYRSIIPLIGIAEFSTFVKGLTYLTLLSSVVFLLVEKLSIISPNLIITNYGFIPLVFGVILIIFICGSRISYRFLEYFFNLQRMRKNSINIVFYGAGQLGKIALDELLINPVYREKYNLKYFIDDEETKVGKKLGGFSIYNNIIPNLGDIDEIWITTSKIDPHFIGKSFQEIFDSLDKKPKIKQMSILIKDI